MGIRMVRQPSETPNITNIDDIIPFRYAYGNQNGYVIGKGTEISHTIQGNTFRINSGRVVLQGVETDIDANGVSFTIDNSSETRYFVVYYEVNLATQQTYIKLSDYSIDGYPTIDSGDNLTVNSSGIARTELYRFTATSGVISNVTKIVKAIEYFAKKNLLWSGNLQLTKDIQDGSSSESGNQITFTSSIYNKNLEIHLSQYGDIDHVFKIYLGSSGCYKHLLNPSLGVLASNPEMCTVLIAKTYSSLKLGFALRLYSLQDLINNPSSYVSDNSQYAITKIYEVLE